jgi:hypothetical protein
LSVVLIKNNFINLPAKSPEMIQHGGKQICQPWGFAEEGNLIVAGIVDVTIENVRLNRSGTGPYA